MGNPKEPAEEKETVCGERPQERNAKQGATVKLVCISAEVSSAEAIEGNLNENHGT